MTDAERGSRRRVTPAVLAARPRSYDGSHHGSPGGRGAVIAVLSAFIAIEAVLLGFLLDDLGTAAGYGWTGPVFSAVAAAGAIWTLLWALRWSAWDRGVALALLLTGTIIALVAVAILAGTLFVFSANYL